MSEDAAGTEEPPEVEGDDTPADDGAEETPAEADDGGEETPAEADDGGEETPAEADDGAEPATVEARLAALSEEVGDDVAEELAALSTEVADLRERAERADDLESRLKRKQAEFENYKKRQEREREKLRERATEAFVEEVVTVRDDLVRALDQDADADLREGLEGTLATFDDVLAEEGVETVEPAPGDEVDPVRHEVLMREESDQPEGTVVTCYRPGYEMAGRVVQTAQVTVSEGPVE